MSEQRQYHPGGIVRGPNGRDTVPYVPVLGERVWLPDGRSYRWDGTGFVDLKTTSNPLSRALGYRSAAGNSAELPGLDALVRCPECHQPGHHDPVRVEPGVPTVPGYDGNPVEVPEMGVNYAVPRLEHTCAYCGHRWHRSI